ncbi:hypothetical protein PF006_g8585 [Phytophthora fragariae]|uniref:Uncharacterized protein n=1 Tax=Phytophthora fragariae TaxID=53985 RepID=A0A6A3U9Y0_9STRA|nr:hypothetical protein PF006_g8585 [Phytophthora fragariae]
MPGAFSGKDANQMEPITIHRVGSSVAILRTKTKPKSLELIGSDGKIYKYLLKAREDLRLDERIMQFLRVTNEFLGADGAAASRDLSAQSYNVIPLSRNAGLIQMVPDVVPLFQVYTSRNEQLANAGRAPQDLTASSSSAQQQPPLPTAQFYAKLKQHGIANVSPNHRAQWSVPVLKQVYQELVAQRPRNVLQQEILLRSEDLRESWVKNARLSNGDIVHIDHNVCFDKGRRLKVPEVVPFRLTPMLQDALGFTGVEGRFRVAFETTLRVVRSDDVREALLTLFEAFVYSPLVDWIADDKRQGRSGDLKARLEVNDIWMSLSAIKLSNAQGQRLLKLAGASWMIKTMDKLNGASSPMPSKATTLSTALKENQMFQFVVAVSHASMTLLDLVSTPKGSMKRLRANELMVGGYQTQREANQEANEGLRLFVEILQAMELFTMSFKEEIVLNLHRRGIDEGLEEELLDMIQGKIATAAGVLEVIDAIISPTTTDGDLILKTSLSHHQATLNMFAAAVDVIQKTSSSVLQSASKSTLDPHASNKALHEINTRVKALEDELKHRQASYAALVSRKRAAEIEFLGVCVENKDAVMETAQTLSKRVKEMRLLLKRFDKFKTPSKQNQAPSSMGSDNLGRPRQLQSEERATTGFCFMENDRLVKILLRSIRSVDHLQLLESVLEKHGETCTSLREAVTQLDQVLREYDAKADALLTASDHNPQDPSRASLLLQLTIDLIEALRVVEPPSGPARPVTADDTSTSLLVVARDLVRGCVKLFFEATEMADRLSSAEDEISRASGIASLPEDEAAEEQVESADDSAPLALESENSVTLPVSGDSGSSAHDTTASTPRSVEKKSQYGLQVLKRIEEKLSGTVTEMAQAPPVLTVEQQATWLIDEATKTDNLCVMYEGWTPWI